MITIDAGEGYQRFYFDILNKKIIQFLNNGNYCEATRKSHILDYFSLTDNYENRLRFKRLDLNLKSHKLIFDKHYTY